MRKVYQQIAHISGNVITVQATGVGNAELATVRAPGFESLAQVIRLEGDNVTMQVFSGTRGVPTDAEIHFLGRQLETPFSEALLGRVFTGGGVPRDGGPGLDEDLIPIAGGVVAARMLGSSHHPRGKRIGAGESPGLAGESPGLEDVRNALRLRYARGEISREDYLQGKVELED